MPPNGENKEDCIEIVQKVVEMANDNAFNENMTDLHLCKTRPENHAFMIVHNYGFSDIRSFLSQLRIEDYCHTSCEDGKPDAYVFSPDSREDFDIYLKLSIEDGVLVISFHEPHRKLTFPYRRTRK